MSDTTNPTVSFAELLRMETEKLEAEEALEAQKLHGGPDPFAPEAPRETVEWLPIDCLENYPEARHPFRAASPERLEELKQSIQENGILNPILVWCRMDGSYCILGGHNRRTAARLIGWTKVPCIVKYDLTESEAEAMMLADNLMQREDLLPSERAKAYKLQLEAMKRQGKSLTSRQVVGKSEVAEIVGESVGNSGRQVQRYIRLNYLLPELLDKVDVNALGLANAEQLSFLSKTGQREVYTYFFVDKPRGRLDKQLIRALRELDVDPRRGIDQAAIDALFLAREESRNFRQVKVPMKPIRHLFPPDITEQEVVERLLEIADAYFRGRKKQ